MLDLDKRLDLSGEPPQLPPYLRKRGGGGGRRILIIPNLLCIQRQTVIPDPVNNWTTVIYQWMDRLMTSIDEPTDTRIELANINTRVYRQWLETYTTSDGVPPHIHFGGAIKGGLGDKSVYPRWCEYARSTFI